MAALLRPLLAVLLISASASAAAASSPSDCVTEVQAERSKLARAADVQRTREAQNDLQLNRTLCQGRLDLLDAQFALADQFEACRRDGVEFPEDVTRSMTRASEELTDRKASWIKTCGPHMKH